MPGHGVPDLQGPSSSPIEWPAAGGALSLTPAETAYLESFTVTTMLLCFVVLGSMMLAARPSLALGPVGHNLLIEPRSAEGRQERLPELAAELVRLGVDVIVTVGGAPARFAKQATAAVPIVMATSVSPVETGLVTSLARPGGNLTGMTTSFDFDMDSKRLQLFKEAVPRISRVGVIHRAPLSPRFVGQPFSVYFKELVAAAQSLKVTVIPLLVEGPDELPAVSAALAREHVDALFVDESPVNWRLRREIAALAEKHRVPWMGGLGEFAEAGALLVYGPNTDDLCRRAASYVDRILRGAKPGDLPIEQPTRFDLVVNLNEWAT